jgi:DNA-binding NtrC family response regulator
MTFDRLQVAVASSDLENRHRISLTLNDLGHEPYCASTIAQCREIFNENQIGLIFSDYQFTDGDYRDLLAIAERRRGRVVLVTRSISPEEYQRARSQGVFGVLQSPCHPTNVEWMLITAKRDAFARSEAAHASLLRRSTDLLTTQRAT